jgi:hypothetical protein
MSGPEHFREAERLVAECLSHRALPRRWNWASPEYANTLAAAQVHATLALAAATVHASLPSYQGASIGGPVADQWDPILTPGTAGEQS